MFWCLHNSVAAAPFKVENLNFNLRDTPPNHLPQRKEMHVVWYT